MSEIAFILLVVPMALLSDPGFAVGGEFFRTSDAPDGSGRKVVAVPAAGDYSMLGKLGFTAYEPIPDALPAPEMQPEQAPELTAEPEPAPAEAPAPVAEL